jgi:hypothetical protein
VLSTYPIALFAHSWIRWVVLVCLVLVVVRTLRGWLGGHLWTPTDERLHSALVGAADLQFLLGLWLYLGASPFVRAFLANPGVEVHTRLLRFFGLEHVLMMVVAVALIHVGRATSQKATDARLRHRRTAIWTLVATLLVLSSIPWPSFPVERPLFRLQLGE